MQAREIVRESRIAIPTVLRAVAIFHFAFIGRILCTFQKVFNIVDGAVQEVSIRRADINMNFAAQLGS